MTRKPIDHRPLSPEERMANAAREERLRHEAETKRQIRRHKAYRMGIFGSFPNWIRQILKFALAIALILMVDGVRRENQEFQASVSGFSGQVQIQKEDEAGWVPVFKNSSLTDGDSITTGQGAYSVLVFPDGSAIQVSPNTQIKVRMLEYSRNGMRTRSFMLNYGSITARLSNYFGYNSVFTICTPTSLSYVKSSGINASYNPVNRRTELMAIDGTVDFQSGNSVVRCAGGQMVSSEYYDVSRPRRMPGVTMNLLNNQINTLSLHEKEPGSLAETEYRLNTLCDPVLQIVGLASGGWDYRNIDFFRRTACKEALANLQAAMESSPTRGAPTYLNLVTLAELQLTQTETNAILDKFHGMMLQSYLRMGADRYTILVRARDRNKTLFQMTETGITEMKGQ